MIIQFLYLWLFASKVTELKLHLELAYLDCYFAVVMLSHPSIWNDTSNRLSQLFDNPFLWSFACTQIIKSWSDNYNEDKSVLSCLTDVEAHDNQERISLMRTNHVRALDFITLSHRLFFQIRNSQYFDR